MVLFEVFIEAEVDDLLTSERGLSLDFFLLLSSLTAVFGISGQSNYAPANSFLDSLSHFRRHKGLVATSLNLGMLGEYAELVSRGYGDEDISATFRLKTELFEQPKKPNNNNP